MQRDWNLPPAVAKTWFYQGCLERPFGKRVRATHKYPFSLQDGVRVEFARAFRKYSANRSFVSNSSWIPWSLKLNWSANSATASSMWPSFKYEITASTNFPEAAVAMPN